MSDNVVPGLKEVLFTFQSIRAKPRSWWIDMSPAGLPQLRPFFHGRLPIWTRRCACESADFLEWATIHNSHDLSVLAKAARCCFCRAWHLLMTSLGSTRRLNPCALAATAFPCYTILFNSTWQGYSKRISAVKMMWDRDSWLANAHMIGIFASPDTAGLFVLH